MLKIIGIILYFVITPLMIAIPISIISGSLVIGIILTVTLFYFVTKSNNAIIILLSVIAESVINVWAFVLALQAPAEVLSIIMFVLFPLHLIFVFLSNVSKIINAWRTFK